MENNIILFATYWNEIDWIKPSLEQIDKIKPVEIIICDGCFDPTVPNYSTDGTREIIEKFVAKRNNARLISPIRVNRLQGLFWLFIAHNKLPKKHYFYLSRFVFSLLASRKSMYKVNQALTFNKMISLSKYWEPGKWFMNYDCDQFYSDEMIERIKKYCNKENDLGLLIGDELTFFENFERYTTEYEKRKFNNMPHRIYKNTWIIPTRGIVREFVLFYKYYIKCVKSKHIGHYFHYKFKKSKSRFEDGYKLGNRKKPDISKYKFENLKIKHPEIVQKVKKLFKK